LTQSVLHAQYNYPNRAIINIRYFGVLKQIFVNLLSNVFSQDIAKEEELNHCQDEEGEMDELENQQESIMKMVIDFSIY
jgi:hypothetical protein